MLINKCENILGKMLIFLLAISVITFSLAEKVKASEQMVSKKAKGKILGYVLGESYFNSSYMQAKLNVDNGEPINSAKLKLKSNKLDKTKKTTSDSDGYFEFGNLKKGKYTITVTKKGYDRTKKKVKLKNGEEKSVEIEMEECKDLSGYWDVEEEVEITCKIGNEKERWEEDGSGTINLQQKKCKLKYTLSAYGETVTRKGSIDGNKITFTGKVGILLDSRVTLTRNKLTVKGFLEGNTMELEGRGEIKGKLPEDPDFSPYEGQNFSCEVVSQSTWKKESSDFTLTKVYQENEKEKRMISRMQEIIYKSFVPNAISQ